MEQSYPQGSILKFSWVEKQIDGIEVLKTILLMLTQSTKNKFLLISLETGNRWTSEMLKGEKNGFVKKEKLLTYFLKHLNNKIISNFQVEEIGNISEINFYNLFNFHF